MRTPTEFELQHLMADYDPAKAHLYYEQHKKLTGRKPGQGDDNRTATFRGQDPRTGKKQPQIHSDAKAKQRKALATQIHNLEDKLKKLEDLIRKTERIEKAKDHKGAAKKERAAKEADKPKSAAEKAQASRDSKKYRDKNQQKVKSAAKKDDDKKDGGKAKSNGMTSAKFKVLAKKVRGQIAVAKQKLAAL